MPVYDIYTYRHGYIDDGVINEGKFYIHPIVIEGPKIKGDDLKDVLHKYSQMSNPRKFVEKFMNKRDYTDEKLDFIFANRDIRKVFISKYLSGSKLSDEILNHPGFVIDFDLFTDNIIPMRILEKIPLSKEYLVSVATSPNILKLFVDRYFPNDTKLVKLANRVINVIDKEGLYTYIDDKPRTPEIKALMAAKNKLVRYIENELAHNHRKINKIMYNVAKYGDGYDTLRAFLKDIDELEEAPSDYDNVNVVESGYIEFPVYSFKGISTVSISIPPTIDLNGLDKNELIMELDRLNIKRAIRSCMNDGSSFRPLLKLVDDYPQEKKWYYISYAAYSVRRKDLLSNQFKEDLLNILYDDRLVTLNTRRGNNTLWELKLKTKLSNVDKIFNDKSGCKDVTYYLLYKLLHKIFPNNKTYWLNRINSTKFDTSNFLEISNDWREPIANLRDGDIKITKGILTFLVCDYYDLKTDLSKFNNIEEYYNSIAILIDNAESLRDRKYIRKYLKKNRN